MKKTKAVLLGVILWSLLLISGCNFIRIEEEPRKPLEYSIVKNEEIQAELAIKNIRIQALDAAATDWNAVKSELTTVKEAKAKTVA